ncbi:helix-hairpin-helix domain-containing protein [Wenyingzhuangia sp. 2_MG-2023]|uniref:ComEA family DNA-binding protein n=1 Tax=Wenyingzhuangia sp. 2_MG-2023 TaxID=3062639 RepID=UPI0026E29360|nr:helix-hairpin-helix domain-containing protein [Wenyingzhuangia sp. 2_MG-2023]MDO6737251.1 helix-hairpin-helix domain-containing protein [Wenyingzhuangia sp. 2_MG-2023]
MIKFLKSHFSYSKSQRNGIFVLILLVVLLQGFVFYVKFETEDGYVLDSVSMQMQVKLDSLENAASSPNIIYPFNPNYISDYKAYQFGMSVNEIDRLFAYRKKGKYVNSVKEFKDITQVSDSLLKVMSPYFKFPDWVNKSNKQPKKTFVAPKKVIVKDINTATEEELVKIYGIGQKRAQTILGYRTRLGGFTYDRQIDEVWGLTPEVLINLKKEFQVLSKPVIVKIDINQATVNDLKSIIYINYKQAKSIIEYRREVAEIQNLAELKTITDFPVDKYDLISLYLHAQ